MILSDSESSGQEKLSSTRKILINKAQQQKFKNNLKSTGKYTILTFLPKFLFEQFRKYANIFFLTIGLLQQIPGISPAGRYVTIVPFLVILAITAIKEAVEDFKRHLEDRKINDSRVKKFHNGDWIETKWKNICVGDILMVMNDMVFPADLVMLASSEAGAVCYVETANLDGETNLKIRSANVTSKHIKDAQGLTGFCGEIEAEGPNQNLYDFTGNITNNWRETNSIGPSELLLRGSKLRNTKWIYGIAVYTGADSKLMMNSTNGPLKQSTVEKVMNYQIIFLFLILTTISLISAAVNKIQFTNGEVHSYLTTEENSGNNFFLNFLTFFILYNNLIPISLLVSLETVRVFQAVFIDSDVDTYAVDKTSSLNKEKMSPMTHMISLIKEETVEDYEFSEKCQSLKGDEFYEVVDRVTRECVPTKLRRTGHQPLWMTNNIMRILRKKRRLWRAYTEEGYYRKDYRGYMAYQEVQKELRKQIRKAKRKLLKDLAKKAKRNPKKFNAYMMSKTSKRVSVGPLMGEEVLVTDNREMAGILNAQTGVFTREDTNDLPEAELLYTGDDPRTDIRFDREEVEKKLKNSKLSGGPGPDKIWSRVINDMADLLAGLLAEPLAIIYNKLTEEGGVPFIRRMANVFPIFGLNSAQMSGIQDPIRLAWSFYVWSYMVLRRNLRQLHKRPLDNYAITPILGSRAKRVDDNKQILGAAAADKRVDRNIAKLIEHKHRTANDIEKNPGPPMVNISYMKLFFTFDSNQQKNYTNGLTRRIRHLYADTMKNKIPMKLYNEENLDIIQNIFGLCIKDNYDSDIMALIDFLNSHWYEKVREMEDAGEAVVASDELKEENVATGQDQAVSVSPLENIQLSSGVETKTPHRNRSTNEIVKKQAHWECPWCKKAFRRRNGCNKHMQVSHPYGGNLEAQYVTPVPKSTNSTVTSEFTVVEQSEVFNIDASLSMPAITGTAGEWQTFVTPEFQLANPVLLYQEPPVESQHESHPQVAPLFGDRLGN